MMDVWGPAHILQVEVQIALIFLEGSFAIYIKTVHVFCPRNPPFRNLC